MHVQEVTSLSALLMHLLVIWLVKSYASGEGKQFKFTAPCHGVIMTIFSIEPKRRYLGGFDRINAVTILWICLLLNLIDLVILHVWL